MCVVARVRILVDGYSLLHSWPELRRGHAPHTAPAGAGVIRVLARHHGTSGTAITDIVDGSRAGLGTPSAAFSSVEVLHSSVGQTADQPSEQAARRLRACGEVLAVTDDHAAAETVLNLGAFTCSCRHFVQRVENALAELADEIKTRNWRERQAFKRCEL